MSGFREEFKFVFDVVGNKQATKAFADVGKQADVAGAKVEAGAGKANKSFASFAKTAAPYASAAAAVGTAILAAANKFEKLAIESGKFADATGLTVEAASRWIEVGSDMGIEAGTIEGAIGKMNKALATSPAKFEALGVAVAHTSTGAVDMNETFLRAVAAISKITDPTRKAQAAAALFGKSWQSMAELIGTGADDLREKLQGVSDAQVIDAGELAKAKRYREAMDNLSDAMSDLAMRVGEEAAPALADLADGLTLVSKVAGPAMKALNAVNPVTWVKWGYNVLGAKDITVEFASDIKGLTLDADGAIVVFDQFGKAIDDSTTYAKRGTIAQDDLNYSVKVSAEEARKAAAATRILNEQWEALLGQFDSEATSNRITETAKELTRAAKRGKLSPDQVLSFKSDTGAAFRNLGMSERTFRATIVPTIDRGEYDRVAALLDALTKFRIAPFEPRLTTTKLSSTKEVFATGGNIGTKGGIVGDAGPEYFQPASAGRIFTSGELARAVSGGGSSGGVVNIGQIVVQGGSADDGRKVVEAIKQYERMAGSGWRN